MSFLHSLGSLQHFTSDALKSKVVINPQWIVDVMACVVSVRSNAIQVTHQHGLLNSNRKMIAVVVLFAPLISFRSS